jgi:hypothetical protein
MTLTIVNGRVEDTFKPAPHYLEIAVACRAMGMDISNDDYEKIDTLLESNSVWATLASDTSTDLLLAGHLPHSAAYSALAN